MQVLSHSGKLLQVATSQSDIGILTGCCADFQLHLEATCTAARALKVPVQNLHKRQSISTSHSGVTVTAGSINQPNS